MPQKLQELQFSVFPPTIQILIFCTQTPQFQHLPQFLEFWHKAKLLESGHATNKSCPDRSPLPPVESISPSFDFDNSKIFWQSSQSLKSQKKLVTVQPPTVPPTLVKCRGVPEEMNFVPQTRRKLQDLQVEIQAYLPFPRIFILDLSGGHQNCQARCIRWTKKDPWAMRLCGSSTRPHKTSGASRGPYEPLMDS